MLSKLDREVEVKERPLQHWHTSPEAAYDGPLLDSVSRNKFNNSEICLTLSPDYNTISSNKT